MTESYGGVPFGKYDEFLAARLAQIEAQPRPVSPAQAAFDEATAKQQAAKKVKQK
jgi:hypothetical protein